MKVGASDFQASLSRPMSIFIAVHVIPFIVFVLCEYLSDDTTAVVIFLIIQFICFAVTKNKCGYELVGLSWKIEPIGSSIIQVYSKPAPYVPPPCLSNCFWIVHFISIALWLFLYVFLLFQKKWRNCLMAIFGGLAVVINLIFFTYAHSKSRQVASQLVRTQFADENINFKFVHDSDNSENELLKDSSSDV